MAPLVRKDGGSFFYFRFSIFDFRFSIYDWRFTIEEKAPAFSSSDTPTIHKNNLYKYSFPILL